MSEHAGRYGDLARFLVSKGGIVVISHDHRGHGHSSKYLSSNGELDDRGFAGEEDSWNRIVHDLYLSISNHSKNFYSLFPEFRPPLAEEEGGKPKVVLLAHSMGSFAAQTLLYKYPDLDLRAVYLSGTAGKPPAIASVGKLIARFERYRQGKTGRSSLINKLSFSSYNGSFKPVRTQSDWLSRDPAQVDSYINDPLCGFICTNQLWIDLLAGLSEMSMPENQARVRKDLPIFIGSGAMDPVGDFTRSTFQLIDAYRAAGLQKIDYKFYPGARHEIFNESNREEVYRDFYDWVSKHFNG